MLGPYGAVVEFARLLLRQDEHGTGPIGETFEHPGDDTAAGSGMKGRLWRLERAMARILMISGSLRHRSTNTALLRTASTMAPSGVEMLLYEGTAGLPHFNPDEDGPRLPPTAAALRAQIREADAVLLSTPEYAGALPGSFKNVFDWAVGDDRPGSLNEKPVAYINVSPRGAALAHASLRAVLGYVGASIVETACVDIPLTQASLDDEGLIASEEIRRQVAVALAELITGMADTTG